MTITKYEEKVRAASKLLLITRSAKAAIIQLRRFFKIVRSSGTNTGKTGVQIAPVDRLINRENETNEAHDARIDPEGGKLWNSGDEGKNFDNENLENELREFLMNSNRGKTPTENHP